MPNAIRNLAVVHLERRPEEAARVLERCSGREAAALLERAPASVAGRVLASASPRFAADCFAALRADAQGEVLGELSPLPAAALLRRRPRAAQEPLLGALPAKVAAPIRDALAYPEDSAGASASGDAVTLFEDLPVARAVEIVGHQPDVIPDRVIVLDRARRVLGVLKVPALCWAPSAATVGSLPREELPVIRAGTAVAKLRGDPRWDGALAPVVDRSGAFLGVLDPASLHHGRRHDAALPMGQLVVAFSELCWIGLSAVLTRRTAAAAPAESERRRG